MFQLFRSIRMKPKFFLPVVTGSSHPAGRYSVSLSFGQVSPCWTYPHKMDWKSVGTDNYTRLAARLNNTNTSSTHAGSGYTSILVVCARNSILTTPMISSLHKSAVSEMEDFPWGLLSCLVRQHTPHLTPAACPDKISSRSSMPGYRNASTVGSRQSTT